MNHDHPRRHRHPLLVGGVAAWLASGCGTTGGSRRPGTPRAEAVPPATGG